MRHLRDDVLQVYLADNVKARSLKPDGSYVRVKPEPGQPLLSSQAWLLSHASARDGAALAKSRPASL